MSALAAHLLDASADHNEIISNAGTGHVSSCLVYARPLSNAGLAVFFSFFYTRSREIIFCKCPFSSKVAIGGRVPHKPRVIAALPGKRLFRNLCPNRLGGLGQSQVHNLLRLFPQFT